ncbi:MAG: hypothetical protein AAFY25_00325 [Pseudomonadota bacterium]
MTQKDDTTPLTFLTYLSATERGVLPLERPTLLGTFSGPDGIKALVRLPSGDIRDMRRNDFLGQAKVLAVREGQLDLGLLGEVHRLTIPGAA